MMVDNSETESTRKCFKYHHHLSGNINLVYNATNSMLCFWNKYQIFLHDRLNFEDTAKIIVPEFNIRETLLINNYLICLDDNENVHLISLKFKHSGAKRPKSSFHLKEKDVLRIAYINDDLISLKKENGIFFICSYKINADLSQFKKQQVITKDKSQNGTKCLLFVFALTSNDFDMVKEIFNAKDTWKDHYLLIISFNGLTLYGCLSNSWANGELNFIKLYTAPTEIADIKILYTSHPEIIIGLATGTLICLALNTGKSCKTVHLNTPIHKFLEENDSIIYTDGATLWKADNVFEQVTFRQFFVKQVKDFIKCREQIICTTYNNYIYMFPIDDDSSYIKSVSNEEYCSAEHLLNNSEYLYRILEEINKLETLSKKISNEKNYITTLALSNKQAIVDSIVQYKITVLDNYEEILNEDRTLTFTDDPSDIFNKDNYIFILNITTTHLQQNFKEILSNVFGDLRIHITFSTNNKIIKTTTIIIEELKKADIVLALKSKCINFRKKFYVNIQLITRIPGVLDAKRNLWACLHEKNIHVTSENFIKTGRSSRNVYLKQRNVDISHSILETAMNQYGSIFTVAKATQKPSTDCWNFFVKLPNNYKEVFQSDVLYRNIHKRRRLYLKEQTSDAFIKSQTTLQFMIGVAQDTSVNWSLYTTLETLQRDVKNSITSDGKIEDFLELHNTFQRNITANFPIYEVFYLLPTYETFF
ncbi:unnamed protein product [Leptosia nina]|uniref:Uncharacterized protein n=1 Tax=Leptosia nina TaxID=320188 RepID=A0AAV1J4X3_9NEOP